MKAILSVCIFMLCSGCTIAVKFPSDIQRCAKGDSKCIVNSANDVIKLYSQDGSRNINLLPLDPLSIPRIHIVQGEESPVNVVLTFTNNTLTGLHGCTFYKIEGFDENIERKYEIHLKGPRTELVGPYTVSGQVLILPIQGTGRSNITVLDPDFTITFNGKSETRNGKVYLKPTNVKLTFEVSKMIYDLSNLYNGDKLLGDNTNLFLNENWQDIHNEIKKSVFSAFSQIAENILTQIFSKVPYDELFKQN